MYDGHDLQRINVTVNVPRSYFVNIYKMGKSGDKTEPDDTALKPVVDLQLVDSPTRSNP